MVKPNDLTKLPFNQLTEWLVKIFAKPSNTTTERYKFHRMLQQADQFIQEYIEQLRRQASKCRFGNFEN